MIMITAFGLAVLLGVARLVLYGYKNKGRRNNDLLFKQIEINQQNRKLQDLIMEKDKLISEKDLYGGLFKTLNLMLIKKCAKSVYEMRFEAL